MNKQELYCGDCLAVMPSIPDSSIDLVLCDLPYGTSVVHKWTKALPLEKLWKEYERIIKQQATPTIPKNVHFLLSFDKLQLYSV